MSLPPTRVNELNDHMESLARRAQTPEVARLQQQLIQAQRVASLNARAKSGELVEDIITDRTGRRISHFYGDTAATWAPFKSYSRRLTGFNEKRS